MKKNCMKQTWACFGEDAWYIYKTHNYYDSMKVFDSCGKAAE